ncbi:hypothetical protein ACW2QC_17040 [Virgibacillus sp. FSP13]
MRMTGFQEPVESKLSYEEVVTILRDKLGHLVDVESLLPNKQEEKEDSTDESNDLLKEFRLFMEREGFRHEPDATSYDIENLDNLIHWKQGMTIHPQIEKLLTQIKDFVRNDMKENSNRYSTFQAFADYEKMQLFIKSNRQFYLRKQAWDNIMRNIDQVSMTNAVYCILLIKAEEMNINKLCKAFLNNHDLLEHYILGNKV